MHMAFDTIAYFITFVIFHLIDFIFKIHYAILQKPVVPSIQDHLKSQV